MKNDRASQEEKRAPLIIGKEENGAAVKSAKAAKLGRSDRGKGTLFRAKERRSSWRARRNEEALVVVKKNA